MTTRAVHVADLDEARRMYGSLYTAVSLERTSRRLGFSWRSRIAQLGPLSVASSRYSSGLCGESDSVDDLYSLSLPLVHGAGRAVVGGEDMPFGSAVSGFAVSPKMPAKVRFSDGYRGLQLTMRREALEEAHLSLHGAPVRGVLQLRPQVVAGEGEGTHVRLLRFLAREIELGSPALSSPPLVARYVEALLYTLIVEQRRDQHATGTTAPSAGPAHLRKSEEFIAAHADQHISLSTLAAAAGVSVRSLQVAFRRQHGCSPAEFMRSQRLLLARRRLLARPDGATVAEIALSCGFTHLGRFSVQYRALFGESPSRTLRGR
ncbi:MAG: AraC family transcriptional regulator [Polyangiaceae bacterium]|nr:AraC family transcriptional regulator [Polyangiaceae bacterium]